MAWARRGRPKSAARQIATPELLQKHSSGITREAIDVILEKKLITESEHWCAVHFRWLYGLCYGIPSTSAVDLSDYAPGRNCEAEDEIWRENREREMKQAFLVVKSVKAEREIMRIAVHNIPPLCLKARPDYTLTAGYELDKLRLGLSALEKIWCKKNRTYLRP